MNITIERVVEATPEVHDLTGELNDVLGAAYEADQRHGLAIGAIIMFAEFSARAAASAGLVA